jgi:hypothetical protein
VCGGDRVPSAGSGRRAGHRGAGRRMDWTDHADDRIGVLRQSSVPHARRCAHFRARRGGCRSARRCCRGRCRARGRSRGGRCGCRRSRARRGAGREMARARVDRGRARGPLRVRGHPAARAARDASRRLRGGARLRPTNRWPLPAPARGMDTRRPRARCGVRTRSWSARVGVSHADTTYTGPLRAR